MRLGATRLVGLRAKIYTLSLLGAMRLGATTLVGLRARMHTVLAGGNEAGGNEAGKFEGENTHCHCWEKQDWGQGGW